MPCSSEYYLITSMPMTFDRYFGGPVVERSVIADFWELAHLTARPRDYLDLEPWDLERENEMARQFGRRYKQQIPLIQRIRMAQEKPLVADESLFGKMKLDSWWFGYLIRLMLYLVVFVKRKLKLGTTWRFVG
ncbi:hypothetical protein TWF694_010116 [Orbilia ellipsospora]|uniref:Uncharacterized protein n=1 Tax=Orbilia ellipsospora TaxID=2528407 RepID=A0AAV9XC12_9PEZI